jgi:hypothetical protein
VHLLVDIDPQFGIARRRWHRRARAAPRHTAG